MSSSSTVNVGQDALAQAVARVLSVANCAAQERGFDPEECLVTITEEARDPARVWRIHYGPRDFVNRRGGDLIVLVDEATNQVQRVLRGQ